MGGRSGDQHLQKGIALAGFHLSGFQHKSSPQSLPLRATNCQSSSVLLTGKWRIEFRATIACGNEGEGENSRKESQKAVDQPCVYQLSLSSGWPLNYTRRGQTPGHRAKAKQNAQRFQLLLFTGETYSKVWVKAG